MSQELSVVWLPSLAEVEAVDEVEQAVQLLPSLHAAAHCSLVQLFQPCVSNKHLCGGLQSKGVRSWSESL